ncbi:MAG: hypothetical protein IJH34_11330 [Romboutsia sp.]|nr:hypothetical protein [Romboutsia sp.]
MFLVVLSLRFGEQTEVFTLDTLEEAYSEVKFQLKDKICETAEDYALVYEIIPGSKQPKFICNDSDILNLE